MPGNSRQSRSRVLAGIGSVPYVISSRLDRSWRRCSSDSMSRLRKVGLVGSTCTRCCAMARQMDSGCRSLIVTIVPPWANPARSVLIPPM